MPEGRFRDVVYFTCAWGLFAVAMVAVQPGAAPIIVKPAQAAERPVEGAPPAAGTRIVLASVLELAE